MDKEHHLYEPGNKYETAILDYYKYLDTRIGELLAKVGDETVVLVISDHGAKRMKGAFCINEWLIREGDLVLKEKPKRGANIEKTPVDWPKTKVWGWGGYYARLFFNVEGREPQGIIKPEDYEKEREAMIERLMSIRGPNGEAWATRVIKPNEYFADVRGDYPDLMVYFDDLYWRSAGTLGYGTLYLRERHGAGRRCPRPGGDVHPVRSAAEGKPAPGHRHHRRGAHRPDRPGPSRPAGHERPPHQMTGWGQVLTLNKSFRFRKC
jgi:predicted AlkP superfamily phosphohydrolase/phosphomutase